MTTSAQLLLFPLSTSCAEDSPAKTSASLETGGGSTEPAPVFGFSLRASSRKRSPAPLWLKTSPPSPVVGFLASCKTLPTSGSWGHGMWSPQPPSEPRTSDDASLSLLPTPTASSYGSNQGGSAGRSGPMRASREMRALKGLLPTPTAMDSVGSRNATANRSEGSAPFNKGETLTDALWLGKLPTPRATDATHGGRVTQRKGREGGNLVEAVSKRLLPTPTAHLAKETGAPSESNRKSPTRGSATGAGGSLHPQFVEWMMGFEQGWTDLDDDDPPTTSTASTPSETP